MVYLLGENLSNHLFNHSFFASSSWVFNHFVIEPLPHLEARQTALPGCTELVSELQLIGFGPSMATFGSLFGSSCADNYHEGSKSPWFISAAYQHYQFGLLQARFSHGEPNLS